MARECLTPAGPEPTAGDRRSRTRPTLTLLRGRLPRPRIDAPIARGRSSACRSFRGASRSTGRVRSPCRSRETRESPPPMKIRPPLVTMAPGGPCAPSFSGGLTPCASSSLRRSGMSPNGVRHAIVALVQVDRHEMRVRRLEERQRAIESRRQPAVAVVRVDFARARTGRHGLELLNPEDAAELDASSGRASRCRDRTPRRPSSHRPTRPVGRWSLRSTAACRAGPSGTSSSRPAPRPAAPASGRTHRRASRPAA